MCLELVPAGVLCWCRYDKTLPVGPISLTNTQEGTAAAARDKRKRRDHAHDGTPGYTFVPFSIESYGRLGVEADKLLKDWATWAASTGAGCISTLD